MRFSSPHCSRAVMKSRRSRYCMLGPRWGRVGGRSVPSVPGVSKRPHMQKGRSKPRPFACTTERLLALHGHEEFFVGLGVLELVEQELDGGDLVHRVQQLAQDPHALQLILGG